MRDAPPLPQCGRGLREKSAGADSWSDHSCPSFGKSAYNYRLTGSDRRLVGIALNHIAAAAGVRTKATKRADQAVPWSTACIDRAVRGQGRHCSGHELRQLSRSLHEREPEIHTKILA